MGIVTRNPLTFPCGVPPRFDPNHFVCGRASTVLAYVPVAATPLTGIPGAMREMVSGRVISHNNSDGGAPHIDGILGPVLSDGSQSADSWYNRHIDDTAAPVCPANTGVTQAGIIRYFTNGGYQGVMCSLTYNGGAPIFAINGASLDAFPNSSSARSMTQGDPYFIVQSEQSNVRYYALIKNLRTGAMLYDTQGAGGARAGSAGGIRIGASYNGASQYCSCPIAALVQLQDRFLSIQELIRWSDDPWSFWYPHV